MIQTLCKEIKVSSNDIEIGGTPINTGNQKKKLSSSYKILNKQKKLSLN
jgi:hypothetical protein